MTTPTVREDRKCAECRKGWAVDSGICLKCVNKAMGAKPMRSAVGRAVQKRIREILRRKP